MTVDPSASSKVLEITVGNCAKYKVMARLNGKDYTYDAVAGLAEIEIDEIPTEEKTLSILLSADGFTEKAINVKVKMDIASAPDLTITFIPQGGDSVVIENDNQNVFTETETATLKISSPKSPMKTLSIDGKDIALTDANSREYTHQISGITSDKSMPIVITYKYYTGINRTFNIKKYNQGQTPMEIVSAKVFHGDKYGDYESLHFNEQGKAEVALNKIRFSTVKVEMTFNINTESREVTVLKGNKTIPPKEKDDMKGRYAGYVVGEVVNGEEKKFTPTSGKKYTEEFIVGISGAEFKIKVNGQNSKQKEFEIKINNTTNAPKHVETQEGGFLAYNGVSGRPLYLGTGEHVLLPSYSKGPIFSGGNTSDSIHVDLAYENKMAVIFQDFDKNPYWFYYNQYKKDQDKHEFIRIEAKVSATASRADFIYDPSPNPSEKGCLDMLVAWENDAPYPLWHSYYNQEFTKLDKPNNLFLIGLLNDKKLKFSEKSVKEDVDSGLIFDFIFNYRIQTQHYAKQSDENTSPLVISKNQKFKWIQDDTERPTWAGFLKGDGTDKFVFKPAGVWDYKKIKSIKHTIWTGDEKDSCSTETQIKDVQPKVDQKARGFVLGTKNGGTAPDTEEVKFMNDKVYKVKVDVEYNDGKSDVFLYVIDYKNENTLDFMGCDLPDTDSNLFGVPTYFGVMKNIDMLRKPVSIW